MIAGLCIFIAPHMRREDSGEQLDDTKVNLALRLMKQTIAKAELERENSRILGKRKREDESASPTDSGSSDKRPHKPDPDRSG
jgi:hypothetical protein